MGMNEFWFIERDDEDDGKVTFKVVDDSGAEKVWMVVDPMDCE
jgi:hypothetical protein